MSRRIILGMKEEVTSSITPTYKTAYGVSQKKLILLHSNLFPGQTVLFQPQQSIVTDSDDPAAEILQGRYACHSLYKAT
jgi:hypothetical protein